MSGAFRHRDHARTLVFGPGAVAAGRDLLPAGYALLTTARALRATPELGDGAALVLEVPAGAVDVLAAALLAPAGDHPLVALGGGRVIDTAKAIAAAAGGRDVVAVPTSLSAAEMTGVHRHARGAADGTPRVRPSVVLNDPALSASLPTAQLAASSANALAHAVAAATHPGRSPIAGAVAREAIVRTGRAWAGEDVDREEAALAALLAGWGVDATGLGLHHALAQTLVRTSGLAHAHVNAALLPATVRALRPRAAAALAEADAALGRPLEALAQDLRGRAGADGLGDLATDTALRERVVVTASRRPELHRLPPAMDAGEIRETYLAAALRSEGKS